MLYSDADIKLKRVRGPALSIFGSFAFALSTYIVIRFTADWTNLYLALLSILAVVGLDIGPRMRGLMIELLVLMASGVILTFEVVLAAYFLPPSSSVYGLLTLITSALSVRGVRDLEDVKKSDPYQTRRQFEKELV